MKLLKTPTSPFARLAEAMLIEAGVVPQVELVNPWANPDALTQTNPARRVPTLILDDGTVLTEALLIARHAAAISPPDSHLRQETPAQLALAGYGFGAIEAAVAVMIGRKITSDDLANPAFDSNPVAARRRQAMVDCLRNIEARVAELRVDHMGLAEIMAANAVQYVDLRFPGADWRPSLPQLDLWLPKAMAHPSIWDTAPK